MQMTASSDDFEQLFDAEYPRVVAVARRITGNAQAEDIAQEVFTAYLRGSVSGRDHARAWLHRVAVHRALNAVRDEKRRTRRERHNELLENASRNANQPDADPSRLLERSEIRKDVRAVLSRISQRYATVLAMRYGGLTYKEISQAMNVRPDAVGTLLIRAERALKREIERVALSR
ncbi:MAG: sigma-70 family RNA polymerase sigma factor [Candidatus Eremiobacteraeota bacterium]|nr:sigma-70 family RNA polymerase sigma factor [Candidatus Eremiobacteraeota bacterium]